MSIEIGKRSSIPGRRITTDQDRLLPWCGGFLQINDEDKSLYFAHRTIYDFITGSHTENELKDFHVDVNHAEMVAGDICVTYLHLDEFQTTLSRQSQQTRIFQPKDIPLAVLGQGGLKQKLVTKFMSSNTVKVENAEYNVESLASFARANTEDTLDSLNQTHPFMRYVSEYWLSHTSDFTEQEAQTWESWRRLVKADDENGLVQLPWPATDRLARLSWAIHNRHEALVLLYMDRLEAKREAMLWRAVQKGDTWLLGVSLLEIDLRDRPFAKKLLLEAAMAGHGEIVRRLLLKAADVGNFRRDEERLYWAWTSGNESLIAHLVDISRESPLLPACRHGNMEWVFRLCSPDYVNDVDVNYVGRMGRTALHYACYHNQVEVAVHLIEKGADVNQESDFGSALYIAKVEGHLELAKILRQVRGKRKQGIVSWPVGMSFDLL